MLVDEDEFCVDSLDTSYGYAPNLSRKTCRRVEEQEKREDKGDNVNLFVSKEDSAACAEPGPTSFLRTDLNSKSQKSFAVETVVRAKCSKEAVTLTEQTGTSPSEIEKLFNKFDKKDSALLANQLNKELTEEWNSASLFCGLGADHAGLIVGDSLLQTYDLLCNINLHLLVMQRELLKHENKIRALCNIDEVTASSFADGGNKKQLFRLLRSLGTASTSLRNRVASLKCTVLRVPLESTRNNSPTSSLAFLTCGIGVLLGIYLFRHHFLRFV